MAKRSEWGSNAMLLSHRSTFASRTAPHSSSHIPDAVNRFCLWRLATLMSDSVASLLSIGRDDRKPNIDMSPKVSSARSTIPDRAVNSPSDLRNDQRDPRGELGNVGATEKRTASHTSTTSSTSTAHAWRPTRPVLSSTSRYALFAVRP